MATILNLDKRLETIVELCDEHGVIADIGCDHGLVMAELILEGKAENVVATEISKECLNKAIVLANKTNILSYVSFRECDGFKQVSKYDKVEQAVIAGMGGQKIIDILEGKPRRLWDFVLEPQSDVYELRQYLHSHRY
ncbi:MAG: SAM-dependent methyltransferase, partial [Clostridiales bacterium]|nr:SAM-dependent methyltransferase [Candidatus Apopatousia equi]